MGVSGCVRCKEIAAQRPVGTLGLLFRLRLVRLLQFAR